MKVAALVARILLGLLFTLSGAFGFVMLFSKGPPPPPPPGLATLFFQAYAGSHWLQWVDAVQLLAGLMFLANRYVSLALTLSGAMLYNILVFHLTMAPGGIVPGLVATLLWLVVASRHRAFFAILFAPK